jgi:hypothetical protein
LKYDYLKGYAIYVLRYCCYVLKISPISNPTVRARASIFFQYRVVGSTLAFQSENSPGYLQESSTSRKDLQDTPIQPHSCVRAVSSEVLSPERSYHRSDGARSQVHITVRGAKFALPFNFFLEFVTLTVDFYTCFTSLISTSELVGDKTGWKLFH